MTRKMTLLTLPGAKYPGVMDYGEVVATDIIHMARQWATSQKEQAEEALAAMDGDFRIELVEGIHKQRRLKVIQEGRPRQGKDSR